MSTANVTRRLKAEGLPVELVRGEGYHYFIFDDGERYDSKSIMCPRYGDLTLAQWLEEGRTFAREVDASQPKGEGRWKPGDVLKL